MESRFVGRFEVVGTTTVGGVDALVASDPAGGGTVVLRSVRLADEASVARWHGYVARLASLGGHGVARVHQLVVEGDVGYVVQDLVDGPTLAALLDAVRPTEEQALGAATGILAALAHAHGGGVVSGALDPAGVVVDSSGAPWLVDVGLVGAFGASVNHAYAAPERLTGVTPTAASDVFSAAAVTAHLLRGAASLPPGVEGLDPAAARVLAPALALDPAARPTAADLGAALAATAVERHGPDWRSRASIAGLAVGGAAGAAAAGVALASPASAASAALPGAASAPAGTAGASAGDAASATHGLSSGASSAHAGAGPGASSAQAAHVAHGPTAGATSSTGHAATHGAAAAGKGIGLKAGIAGAALIVGGGGVAAAVLLTGGGQSHQLEVPGTADIYLVGTDEVDLGNPGTQPEGVDVDGAGSVSFDDVQGRLAACGGCQPESVDGGNLSFGSTSLTAVNGISGVSHTDRTMFLVGVFVGEGKPDRTDVVDLSEANSETEQHPALGQPFFIGDGKDSHGDQQKVDVPDGAKEMYIGFADGFSFAGQPGAYDDNSGTVSLKVSVD
ncbi:protein kinase domain-containing protein [Nocardioides panacisoli]|uniref:non-specific serine/threonine protein kinase n=1 Tax=Nocardioides panacisoli TaxID=627624 RepID=A0ABP7IST8_9ACTN